MLRERYTDDPRDYEAAELLAWQYFRRGNLVDQQCVELGMLRLFHPMELQKVVEQLIEPRVVTHVLESARRIAEHVIMLDHGEVILDGSIAELDASMNPAVQQFRVGDLTGPTAGVVGTTQFLEDLLQ